MKHSSRALSDLGSPFREGMESLLAMVNQSGGTQWEFRPFSTLRDPWEQASLWRQSRSFEEMMIQHNRLIGTGAPFLAQCLFETGPSFGKHVTNALPGQSWHQWGEACDLFLVVDGKANWDVSHEAWKELSTLTLAKGFDSGFAWTQFPDAPHVQLRKGSPLGFYNWNQIDQRMREFWS